MKKDRADLKNQFGNNIPTESDYADLIDSMLNQQDDGISSSSSGLSIISNMAVTGIIQSVIGSKGEQYKIVTGKTSPDDWKEYIEKGQPIDSVIHIKVDTSTAGFSLMPCYFTSLHGQDHLARTSAVTNLYKPSKDGFEVYLMSNTLKLIEKPNNKYELKRDKLTPSDAKKDNWHICWIAVGI